MACEAQKKGTNYVFTFITKVLSGGDTASFSHNVHPPRPPTPPSYWISMSSWTQHYSDKTPLCHSPSMAMVSDYVLFNKVKRPGSLLVTKAHDILSPLPSSCCLVPGHEGWRPRCHLGS